MDKPPYDEKEIKKKYGSHVDHRTSWLNISQKPLAELGGKSVIDYVKENTDLEDPSMFIASMFEEGLAKRINENNAIKRDGKNGLTTGGNPDYPYSGFFDFGLDTIGSNVDKFIQKGYLKPDIKGRINTHETFNEKQQPIQTADFQNFKDVIDSKLAYLKEAESNIDKYVGEKGLDMSKDAKEYFKYVAYNAGLGNAQGMINSFNDRGYLTEDKFLQDGFEPEYWKDPYKYSMRRWQGADMMRNELGLATPPPLNRDMGAPIDAPARVNPDLMRTQDAGIQAPQRTLDPLDVFPTAVQGVSERAEPVTVEGTTVAAPIDTSRLKRTLPPMPTSPMETEDFMFGGMFDNMSAGDKSSMGGMAAGAVAGLIPTTKRNGDVSVGGSTAAGALKGVGAGAMFGPPGMIIGGAIGGLSSFLGAKKEQDAQMEARTEEQRQGFMQFMSGANLNQGNGSNMPMAMGGSMQGEADMMNPLLVEFNEGGTHESNPLGGIPQGQNAQGKTRTVEEGETAFTFKGKDKYIFSNRLSPLSYDY